CARIAAAHVPDRPPPPGALTPHLPIELAQLVLHCLEKAPGDRFQTMGELQHACDQLIARVAMHSAPTMSLRGYAPSPVYTTLGLSAGQPLPAAPRQLGRSIVLA